MIFYYFISIGRWLSSDLWLKEHLRDLSIILGLLIFLGLHKDLLDGEISVLRGGSLYYTTLSLSGGVPCWKQQHSSIGYY